MVRAKGLFECGYYCNEGGTEIPLLLYAERFQDAYKQVDKNTNGVKIIMCFKMGAINKNGIFFLKGMHTTHIMAICFILALRCHQIRIYFEI